MKNHAQLIIFGASGNLTGLKLIPALYELAIKKRLPENLVIWGVSRREWSDEDFSHEMRMKFIEKNPEGFNEENWKSLIATKLRFCPGDFSNRETFNSLKNKVDAVDKEWNQESEKIFYFAVPPESYQTVLNGIRNSQLLTTCQDTCNKLIIEKPFGHDEKSAEELNNQIMAVFAEEQIYRIDHVLGKDTLEDIISFRKHNPIFNAMLQSEYVDHIQISYLEKIGIEHRGEFYEQTGVHRDVLQNHALQILATSVMEIPQDETNSSFSHARAEVFSSLAPVESSNIVAAQYDGYTQEQNVSSDSRVPTFMVLKTSLTSGKMKDVPVYIRTGKYLKEKYTEILFVFKSTSVNGLRPNILAFRLQPQEGVFLSLLKRNLTMPQELENIELDFCYKDTQQKLTDGYENLLYNVFTGDRTFFVGIEEVFAAWKFIDPISRALSEQKIAIVTYAKGTQGPDSAEKLVEKENRHWYTEDFALACKI